MFVRFSSEDIIPNQQEIITTALFTGNVGNLLTYYTSSDQTAAQKTYYYEIFHSASSAATSEAQFSVAYGHRLGSGPEGEGGQVEDTPSRAIYAQYRQLCLDPGTSAFSAGGTTSNSIYVVNFNRARLKDGLDVGNLS